MIDALDTLDKYIDWIQRANPLVGDARIQIEYRIEGEFVLGGLVSRVDYMEQGYRAVLLGRFETDWDSEMRMPILQRAVAAKYGIPDDEFQIGVQQYDGSGLAVVQYSRREIEHALDAAQRAVRVVAPMI